MNDNIKEITKIVHWYKGLSKDYSGIEDLLKARKQLVTYQFLLAVEVGNARQSWKECEAQTEIIRRGEIAKLIDLKYPMTKAIELAKNESVLMYEAEKIADGYYNSLKFILDASYEVGNTISQHIAYLRKEYELSNFNGR